MSVERAGRASRPDLFDDERAIATGAYRRRNVLVVLAVVALGATGGGAFGWYATRGHSTVALPVPGAADAATKATLPPIVPATTAPVVPSTVAPTTVPPTTVAPTTVVPTTLAPTTTVAVAEVPTSVAPPATNSVGVAVDAAADANSWNAAERWAASLGTLQAEAALSSKAALYTRWFRLAIGPPASAVATPHGFRLTFADGALLELVDLVAAGGKVADLTECPGGEASGNCQQIGDFVDLAALESAGSSPSATVAWLGRVRLRGAQWTLYSMTTTKPVASVSAAYTATYDGVTLMLTGAPPGWVDVTVTFTDATTEVIPVTT